MEKEVILTKHAISRAKNRFGMGNRALETRVKYVLKYGVSSRDVKSNSNLCKYLDSLYFKHRNCNNIRVYNRQVYVLDNQKLVTLFQLPENLYTESEEMQDRKTANIIKNNINEYKNYKKSN